MYIKRHIEKSGGAISKRTIILSSHIRRVRRWWIYNCFPRSRRVYYPRRRHRRGLQENQFVVVVEFNSFIQTKKYGYAQRPLCS